MRLFLTVAEGIMYSVSTGVGPGRPNARSDVLLVQFMMRPVLHNINPFFPATPVNGIMDDFTVNSIQVIQEEQFNQTGIQVGTPGRVLDGAIDPPKGIVNAYGNIYTMVWLNIKYKALFPFGHSNLLRDPGFPIECRRDIEL